MNRTIKNWKKLSDLKLELEGVVRQFVWRAKDAHKNALRYKKLSTSDSFTGSWYDEYLRYRAERSHWIFAAKQILIAVAHDGHHMRCNERCVARILAQSQPKSKFPVLTEAEKELILAGLL